MTLQVLPSSGKFVAASFGYIADEKYGPELMERTYKEMVDSLQARYPMENVPVEDSAVTRVSSMGNFSSVLVRLDRITDAGSISVIELAYLSVFDFALEALMALPERPDIQDTFMGLRLGERYSLSQIKESMYGRGSFLSDEKGPNSIEYTFKDVSFAGRKWDYASFLLTIDSHFYMITLYKSLDNTTRERRNATSEFNLLKTSLDEKYGSVEMKEDNDSNLSATYLGGNDVAALLSLTEEKSAGGLYRLFFKLTYIQRELFEEVGQLLKDEL